MNYYNSLQHKSINEQIELLIDLLYRRKWTIVIIFVVVTSAFAGYAYTRVPVYRADSLIMLDLAGDMPSNRSDVSRSGNHFFATNNRSLSGEIFLLQNSEAIARRVAKHLVTLAENGDLDSPMTILRGRHEKTIRDVDRIAARLDRYVSFNPAHSGLNAIRITAASTVPGEAPLLVNVYSEEYVQLTREESRSQLVAKRKFLEEQEEKRRKELRRIEAEIENYMVEHEIVERGGAGVSLAVKIAETEADREEIQLQLQIHKASLQSLKNQLATFGGNVAKRIAASGLKRQIEGLQEKIAQLELDKEEVFLRYPNLRGSDSTNAYLRSINRQIQQLQEEMSRLSQEYIQKLEAAGGLGGTGGGLSSLAVIKQQIYGEQTAIGKLEARLNITEQRLKEYKAKLQSVPEQSLELIQLQRARTYAERMYQLVVERLQETRIAENSEPGYAHILQKASPSGAPQRPKANRYLILGCFFGLLGGIGAALVIDKLDNRIYKPEEAGEGEDIVVGVVPSMQPFIKEKYNRQSFVEYNGRKIETTLVSLLDPSSALSEAYRHLRTKIQYGMVNGSKVKSLVVTSPGTKDGKSVTAANLAVVLARAGQRTLLVDADLRRPRVHKLFDLPLEPGLVQLWEDNKNNKNGELVQQIIPDLHVLTAGQVVGNSAELLGTRRMREVFKQLHDRFDFVIIDTPPALAITDAAVLSTYCDGVMLICRSGQTKEEELKGVLETFEEVDARVIGLLVNGFDISNAYGHKYKYRQYSKYGSYFGDDRYIVDLEGHEGQDGVDNSLLALKS